MALTEQEAINLHKDPNWRLNHLYKIRTKDRRLITLKANKAQREYYKNSSKKDIILKARQLGFTTWKLIEYLDDTIHNPNTVTAILAHKREKVQKLFEIVKLAYEHLPGMLKPKVSFDNRNELYFPEINSKIYVTTETRSETVFNLHISEFAFMRNPKEVLLAALESVPKEGRISIESTANGMSGLMYEIWNDPNSEFKKHFYNWTWDKDYRLSTSRTIEELLREYKSLPADWELIPNILEVLPNIDKEQLKFYIAKIRRHKAGVKQEYPSTCVTGNSLISTKEGFVKMKNLIPDGEYIKKKYNKGKKQVYLLKTKMGYELECTNDHKILTPNGYFQLLELSEGDDVILGKPFFNNKLQVLKWKKGFVNYNVKVDEDFARFAGFFMGDGSFYKDCVSIVCDKKEDLVIEEVKRLFDKFFNGCSSRVVGNKKGGVEIRKSDVFLNRHFKELGLLRRKNSGGYKRRVCVPDYIKKSPKRIIKEFLIGLFEADGFVDRNGNRVIFFSKYKYFIQDVQLLLLGFGITSKLNTAIKKSGEYKYIGYELVLRKFETVQYGKELGFISKKKKNRIKLSSRPLSIRATRCIKLEFKDKIVGVEKIGLEEVYDITTSTHSFISNGIVVHNCNEAFISFGKNVFGDSILQKHQPKPPIEIKWGKLKVWEQPMEGFKYVMGVDTSEGLGLDNAVIEVFNAHTGFQAAELADGNITPSDLGGFALKIGKYYNNAFIVPEINSSGISFLDTIKKIYYNIYKRESLDKRSGKSKKTLGWKTTPITKPKLVDNLVSFTDDRDIQINSSEAINELKTFVRTEEQGKMGYGAEGNYKDDRVIAIGLAVQGIKDIPYMRTPKSLAQKKLEEYKEVKESSTPQQLYVKNNKLRYGIRKTYGIKKY